MKIMTDPDLDRRLAVAAARKGISAKALVDEMLEEHLPQLPDEKGGGE